MGSERLIVALDVSTAAEAQRIVRAVGNAASLFKIGKQLFTAEGPGVVREMVASGRKVFLDLKFHDIPNTVAGAVRAAAALKVSMLTVHASGGAAMLRAASEAAGRGGPLVLAVTVLTSLSDEDLTQIGVSGRAIDQVLRLAQLAKFSGCGGVVASPKEVAQLRKSLGPELVIVTPGVRPAGSAKGDQTRVATPAEAVAAGANYVVVGRPITEANDPRSAALGIAEELTRAEKRKGVSDKG
jgi:orotidine-5'-phosphate decarboxylase